MSVPAQVPREYEADFAHLQGGELHAPVDWKHYLSEKLKIEKTNLNG